MLYSILRHIARPAQSLTGAAGTPQPSFALKFLENSNQAQSLPVLGFPANSDWVLYAPNVFDPVLIHNPFIHQLSRDMGRYSPRTRFLEVCIVQLENLKRALAECDLGPRIIQAIKVDRDPPDFELINSEGKVGLDSK